MTDTKIGSQDAVKKVLELTENWKYPKLFSKICWKHDTPLQLLGIHYSSAFYNTLLSLFVLKIFWFNWMSLFIKYFGSVSRLEQFIQPCMKYEIIRKLIYLNLDINTSSRIRRWSLTYLINSQKARGRLVKPSWNWDYIKICQLFKFCKLGYIDRPCCHVWKVVISFIRRNFSHCERVTTHYQTLQTWIDLNVTCYHNLNAVPHALTHALPYILSDICLVFGYLQRVAIVF